MQETSAAAEEHLRVIRSLMERATSYRAISAQAALVGGLAALSAGVVTHYPAWTGWKLLGVWTLVLAVATGANLYFLHREARRRGDKFYSPGMKMALKAMAPPLVVGLVITLLMVLAGDAGIEPFSLVWIITYGLALTATAHFAPKSLQILGMVFLGTGLLVLAALCWLISRSSGAYAGPIELAQPWFARFLEQQARWLMALTFGGYHLIYAFCTWPRQPRVKLTPLPEI